MKKKYLSTTELAKLLGISRISVYNKIKKGQIKAIRIGRSFAVPEEEVSALIGKVAGHPLNDEEKEKINKIVRKTVKEYGEVLKLLGEE